MSPDAGQQHDTHLMKHYKSEQVVGAQQVPLHHGVIRHRKLAHEGGGKGNGTLKTDNSP